MFYVFLTTKIPIGDTQKIMRRESKHFITTKKINEAQRKGTREERNKGITKGIENRM